MINMLQSRKSSVGIEYDVQHLAADLFFLLNSRCSQQGTVVTNRSVSHALPFVTYVHVISMY